MHADESRQDGVALQIDCLRICGNVGVRRGPDPLNLSIGDQDGLIVQGGGASPVNHSHVGQSYEWSFDAHELLPVRLLSLHCAGCDQ
jgi:hypothetical protein